MNKITENTSFVNGDESLGITMLDFWKYQYSNIYDMQRIYCGVHSRKGIANQ